MIDFPHKPPDGYSYEYESFNTRLVSIWLVCHQKFTYNSGKKTRSIWGFYSPKKKEYYAPINSLKVGKVVDIRNTRAYTAMPLNQNPLESVLYGN